MGIHKQIKVIAFIALGLYLAPLGGRCVEPAFREKRILHTALGLSERRRANLELPDCLFCFQEKKEAYAKAKTRAIGDAQAICKSFRGVLRPEYEFSQKGCRNTKDGSRFPRVYFLACDVTIEAVCRIAPIQSRALNSLSEINSKEIFTGR